MITKMITVTLNTQTFYWTTKTGLQKWLTLRKRNLHSLAVGAGHLGGEKGVVNLLRKAG
jgi:hypothetical protein